MCVCGLGIFAKKQQEITSSDVSISDSPLDRSSKLGLAASGGGGGGGGAGTGGGKGGVGKAIRNGGGMFILFIKCNTYN